MKALSEVAPRLLVIQIQIQAVWFRHIKEQVTKPSGLLFKNFLRAVIDYGEK